MEEFNKFIDEKIASDSDFQATLETLTDDEKNSLIESKKVELLKAEAPKWFEESNKNKELANNYKIRAEKAEKSSKGDNSSQSQSKNNGGDDSELSSKDIIAISRAGIEEEDIDEVLEYAKFKKIPVSEALKSDIVKNILAQKADFRKTANATQTKATRQTVKLDGNTIINNAKQKGEEGIPDKGSSEAEEMFWARRGGRRS